MTNNKPYAFTFWQSSGPAPDYISLCADTHHRNLGRAFELIQLDYNTCLKWVPERDTLWQMSNPVTTGQSTTQEGRRWAIFCGLLRVALLKKYGGFWIDADTIVFPQFSLLSELVESYDFIASEQGGGQIANSIIGCRKNSPFMIKFWDQVQQKITQKKQTNDLSAHWGEYGHRLIRKLITQSAGEKNFIAPMGMLIQFDSTNKKMIFEPASQYETTVPLTALSLTFYNNSTNAAHRQMTKQQLLLENTIFSKAIEVAMGRDKIGLAIENTKQLKSFNRYNIARDILTALEKKDANLAILKNKLEQRTRKVTRLKNQIKHTD